jgi:membrane-anchored protein YejM (alkaline phosphatase superfamily)
VSPSGPLRIENNAAAVVKTYYPLRGVARHGIQMHRMDDLNNEDTTWLQWLSSHSNDNDKVKDDNQQKNKGVLARINSALETRDSKLHVTVPKVDEKTPVQIVLSEEGINMMQIDLE